MQVDQEVGVEVSPLVADRRRTPDRRDEWRGGRRDSDWTNRPPHAAMEGSEAADAAVTSAWQTLLHSLRLG